MGQRVGASVEIVIVWGFVDADSPENDGRVIPVAANHAANVVRGNILPSCVADVLPARNFLQDEQAEFVACIQKMPGLRIVRGAHDVALEVSAKDLRVTPLHASRHGLTYKGERLMTVEPAQLDHFAVQFEAMFGKPGLTETDGARIIIDQARSIQQANLDRIELRPRQIPEHHT